MSFLQKPTSGWTVHWAAHLKPKLVRHRKPMFISWLVAHAKVRYRKVCLVVFLLLSRWVQHGSPCHKFACRPAEVGVRLMTLILSVFNTEQSMLTIPLNKHIGPIWISWLILIKKSLPLGFRTPHNINKPSYLSSRNVSVHNDSYRGFSSETSDMPNLYYLNLPLRSGTSRNWSSVLSYKQNDSHGFYGEFNVWNETSVLRRYLLLFLVPKVTNYNGIMFRLRSTLSRRR